MSSRFKITQDKGFWDVIFQGVQLKKTLKKSKIGFMMPVGSYGNTEEDLYRWRKMSEALLKKFGCLVVHYPASKWRDMSGVLAQEQHIFVLQEDSSLYHIVKTPEKDAEPKDEASSEEVWNRELLSKLTLEKEFGQHLYQIFRDESPQQVVGIVNQSDLQLRSIFSALRGYSKSRKPCVFIDAEQDDNNLTQTLKLAGVEGYWEVLQKKRKLKEALLQTSLGFYAIPTGNYSSDGIYLFQRHAQILKVLNQKFDWTIVHYPSEGGTWKELIEQSKIPQILLFVTEEHNLYVVDIEANKSLDSLSFT